MSKLIDLVNAGRWKDLFIEELGWTKPTLKPLVIPLEHENDEHDVTLTEVAQYKGVRIWLCNELFDARTQRFVDREVKKHDFRLEEGLVLAVEPMVNMGRADTDTLRDHWTVVTRDRLPSVHVEHTLALTRDGVYVVTADEETYVKA